VLQPLIMGHAVRLNALAVVLAVSAGMLLVGITGAVLAVPLLAALNTGIRSLNRNEDEAPPRCTSRSSTSPPRRSWSRSRYRRWPGWFSGRRRRC